MRLYTHTVEHLEALPLATSMRTRYKGDKHYGGHANKRDPIRKCHTTYKAPKFLGRNIGSSFELVFKKAKEQGITKTEFWFFLRAAHDKYASYYFDEEQLLREISEPSCPFKTVVPKKNAVFTLETRFKGEVTYTDKTWDSELIPGRKFRRAHNTIPDINTLKVLKGEVVVCESKKAPALCRFHAERQKKEKAEEKKRKKEAENKSIRALDFIQKNSSRAKSKTVKAVHEMNPNKVTFFVLGDKVVFRVYPRELLPTEGESPLPWYGFVSGLEKWKEVLKVLRNLKAPYKWKYCIVGDNLDGYLKYKKRVDLKSTDCIISGFTKFPKVINSPLRLLLSEEVIEAYYTEKKLKKMKHAIYTRKNRS